MEKKDRELTVEANLSQMQLVTDFVEETLLQKNCPPKTVRKFLIAMDELFSNLCYYSKASLVHISLTVQEHTAVVCIMNDGILYDPLKKEDPDITLEAEDRPVGGLGIYVVKNLMDEIHYEIMDQQNCLKLKKSWQ